ncbi:MAG TPA: hypothetical protein EYP04_00355 [Anaerolineae bacterium]|nr:hypothetical protein [Anaerolineae bacterium]
MRREDVARAALEQAETLALHSPRLRPAQREELLLRLARIYRKYGDREKARRLTAQAAEPLPGVTPTKEVPYLKAFQGHFTPDSAMEAAVVARRQWVAVLIRELLGRGAKKKTLKSLAEALLEEDAARDAFYQQALPQTPQLSVQAAILQDHIDWLTIKYRIARGGFGMSLVPIWEEEAGAIRAELTQQYEALFALYADQVTALPDAGDIDRARLQVLRVEILLGRLGLYPDYPEEELINALTEAEDQLYVIGTADPLRIVPRRVGDGQLFVLESFEE